MRDYDEYKDAEFLDEDKYEYEDEEEEAAPRKRSGAILPLTGGTLVTTEIVGAMLHGGVLGVGAGLLASAFVWLKGQDLIDAASGIVDVSALTDRLPKKGGRSFKDRMLGHYPDEVDYDAYISSPVWKARARQIRKRDNYQCQDCETKGVPLDVHHLTYERLGNERDEDLITLCRECHDARHNEDIYDDEDEQPKTTMGTLPPRSPKFARMQHLITPERDILGWDGQQFIYADSLKQSVNIALIGVPGSGKTSCLTFHTAQAIRRRAIVRGWDLHGDVAADLGDCFNILEDVDDIVADCEWIRAERERRMSLRKRARAGDRQALAQWNKTRELFYIVDEFNALMLRLKQRKGDRELVADTLLSLIAEGRKFKMRCIIAGQTMPAALFGEGGSSARDIINTKYAFQSRENHAQYFGIESRAIEALLPSISGKGSEGYAILDGGPLLHAIIVSIPYTTVNDIRALVEEYEDEEDEPITEPPVRAARPDAIKLYESGVRQATRRQEREQRLRNAAPVHKPMVARAPEAAVQDDPESSLDRDERAVLDAYRSGLKTGNAIAGETGLSSTRVNQVLNKLARRNLIDWQPRKA